MKKYHEKPNQYINHLALKVMDINLSKRFYTKVMGFKVLEELKNKVVLTVDENSPILTLVQPTEVIHKVANRTGLYHFAILLEKMSDLGLLVTNIQNENYPLTGASNHDVSKALYLQDPDDNGIEIYIDSDDTGWKWNNGHVFMNTERLDVSEILNSAKGKEWEGLPKTTTIGHIHLHVSDLNKARKFYTEGLGYKVTTSFPNQAVFLSTGDYHHHIAINVWNGQNILFQSENETGLQEFSIVLDNEEVREKLVDKLSDLGYEVVKENDKIFTFDPSKNKILLTV